MTIALEKCDCKDLIVKVSTGVIIGDSCKFIYRLNDASQSGKKAIITIHKKKGEVLTEIGKKEFRLKNIPNPIASVGNYIWGKISVNLLKAQSFIKLQYEGFDFSVNIHVKSFVLSVIRGDTCLYTNIENEGALFNEKVQDAISLIRKGDTVIFKNIVCQERSKFNNDIAPIVFYVIE